MNRRDVVAGGGVDARALDSLENCCHGAHPGIDAQTDLSVTRGRIMFEVDGVSRNVAKRAFELASAKLSVRTRFVARLGEED